MQNLCRVGAILVLLAGPASAQLSHLARAPNPEIPLRQMPVQPIHVTWPQTAAGTRQTLAVSKASRRTLVVAATVGAAIGGLIGLTYAVLEGSAGCKAVAGVSCEHPQHLWLYPVGGAVVGGALGFAVLRF
jgi:hypothetical protein